MDMDSGCKGASLPAASTRVELGRGDAETPTSKTKQQKEQVDELEGQMGKRTVPNKRPAPAVGDIRAHTVESKYGATAWLADLAAKKANGGRALCCGRPCVARGVGIRAPPRSQPP